MLRMQGDIPPFYSFYNASFMLRMNRILIWLMQHKLNF